MISRWIGRLFAKCVFLYVTIFALILIGAVIRCRYGDAVFSSTTARKVAVQNYRVKFVPLYMPGESHLYFAIRAFEDEFNKTKFLVVNSTTMESKVVEAAGLEYRPRPIAPAGVAYFNSSKLDTTPYLRALKKYTEAPTHLTNGGVTSSSDQLNGAFMTIDLCPSANPFEQDFFARLVAKSRLLKRPIPVALAVSGLWMLNHQREFDWLQEQASKGYLAITWINHSYSHPYFPNRPLEDNFLLSQGVDFLAEILDVERQLLVAGVTPSLFFRYPGLVSNPELMQQLRFLGLIPVGSSSWLARMEPVRRGSIVLVHGNGNEPQGIEIATELLDKFNWLPLHQAILHQAIATP